jgi:hypothetical protein
MCRPVSLAWRVLRRRRFEIAAGGTEKTTRLLLLFAGICKRAMPSSLRQSYQAAALVGNGVTHFNTGSCPDWAGWLILQGVEYYFACPYCRQQISVVLDTSVKGQTYAKDCEVLLPSD